MKDTTLMRAIAMTETSEELIFVAMEEHPLPHAHAELVSTPWGWQVELHDVPCGSCPPVRQIGAITVETVHGYRCAGTVIADLVTEDGGFVLLSGIGRLQLYAPAYAA
jgi:hypothetical protein